MQTSLHTWRMPRGPNHAKMFQRFPYILFFLWRAFRLTGIFRLWHIIVYPLNNTTYLLYLCNIQAADLSSSMLQYILLDFLIGGFALRNRQIPLTHLQFHFYILFCMKFGKQTDNFHIPCLLKLMILRFSKTLYALKNQPFS